MVNLERDWDWKVSLIPWREGTCEMGAFESRKVADAKLQLSKAAAAPVCACVRACVRALIVFFSPGTGPWSSSSSHLYLPT